MHHTLSYHSGYGQTARATLLADIPEVPEVHLQPLLASVFPDVSANGLLDQVCNRLMEDSVVNQRWWCLAHDPTNAFRFIEQIFNRILSLDEVSQALVKCTVAGNIVPLTQRTNNSRPDGYIHMRQETFISDVVAWADIVMPMEFKQKMTTQSSGDDFAKVICSMHHIMRNDPRRRFVYGLTIEDTSTRLWFNDRCGIVSSTAFDINEDWRYFVHIVLGIVLADTTELGFDPDMKLSEENRSTGAPPVAYDITVRQSDKIKKVYRTVEILSDIGAESLIGRGTRVWKVQELDDNGERFGPFYALKDVWVHDDRPMEHDTLAEIKKQQPSYERHFLTVLCAGFATVKIGDSSQPDNTKGTIRRGHDFSLTNQVLRLRATITENQDNSRKRKAPSTSGTAYEFIQYTPTARREGRWNHGYLSRSSRQHYRIVFKEVGVPVHRLRNYQDIITAITGGSEGLYAIHLTNQIHRDISSGNIMLVQEDGKEARGVIIDLEYIQRLDSTIDSHGAKKGTYEFIAVEVAAEEYLSEAEPEESLDTQTTPRIVRPFRQNPLHDLESVWWLCIWVLFRTVRADEHPTNRYLHNYLKAFGSQGDRYVFWNNGPLFKRYTAHFSEPVFSRAMRYWCNKLKEVYKECYMENEFVEIPISFLHKARSAQREALDALSEITKNYHSELRNLWELMPLPDTPETQSENGNNDSGSKLRAPEGPELKKQRNANNVD